MAPHENHAGFTPRPRLVVELHARVQWKDAYVYIDACSVAAGAYHNGDMVYTPWASWPGSEDLHINNKEALTLETAVCHWAPRWTNKKIHVFCDNQCAVSVINKGRSKYPFVMQSLRRIFWWSAMFNFHISASYVPGQYNNLADAISRLHEPNGHIIQLFTFVEVNTSTYFFNAKYVFTERAR